MGRHHMLTCGFRGLFRMCHDTQLLPLSSTLSGAGLRDGAVVDVVRLSAPEGLSLVQDCFVGGICFKWSIEKMDRVRWRIGLKMLEDGHDQSFNFSVVVVTPDGQEVSRLGPLTHNFHEQ